MNRKYWLIFLLSFFITITYALITDHRWEDWYITYRASKNLAMGDGLTFTKGERVHSFTSPINTLLPAFFAFILYQTLMNLPSGSNRYFSFPK